MPDATSEPGISIQDVHIVNVAAIPSQNSSSQHSETRAKNEPTPVVYETIRLSVRKTSQRTEIDVGFDADHYMFVEQKDLKTGISSISFLKNHETEWEKSFPRYTLSTVLMDFAQMFTDKNINRPGTVVRELRIFYTRYCGSSFCLNLFNLIRPDIVTVESCSFSATEAVLDPKFTDCINNIRAARIDLSFTYALGNREFLLNLQSPKQHIFERIRISMADADLFIEHIKRLLSRDFDIGSFYRAEQFRDSLPDDFVQNVMEEFTAAEPARNSKFFKIPLTKDFVPLTYILPVTPTTDLEIYNDNVNFIAVLAETETFPPADMKNLHLLVLGETKKGRSDNAQNFCCHFSPCHR